MVSKPTVLVVGAGASAPFGFPSGKGLVELIQKDIGEVLLSPKTPVERIKGHRRISPFEEFMRTDEALLREAEALGRGLSRSGSYSIDAFVETRREFVSISKLAIAASLIPRENEHSLFSEKMENSEEIGDWYRYLSNRLLGNIARGCVAPLTVVTYNYDRSLEHYLHCSLCTALGLNEQARQSQLGNLSFVHLHGSLGKLEWQEGATPENVRSYLPSCDLDIAKKAANQIKIIHENEDDTPEYQLARKRLAEAERVCFLGFGFHRTNVRRLTAGGWTKRTGPSDRKLTVSTAYGLTESERTDCQNLFRASAIEALGNPDPVKIHGPPIFDANGHRCLRFLRENVGVID